ncbi:head GIN domain-containing protein [Parabacteroides sp. AM08-6]|uniref:head GIN domain-containing protein n=1 Tax=Parabacteroides sp. AM08-6 TaxID=2292053 RepID=UPI000EFED9DB|nr:head GIN domain-containing protein [Parabacteroides sp. AM08-6]RHJ82707.1 DUF2807 domain-containing protein [Parabacteroides sp. AM08-6]
MKTRLLALIALLTLCAATGKAEKIKGDGNVITKEINISDYNSLEITGNISQNQSLSKLKNNEIPTFNYSQKSGSPSLTITIDKNLLPLLIIESSNGKLSIRVEKNKHLFPTQMIISSNSTQLENLRVSGSFYFKSQTPLNGNRLKVMASGASDVYLKQAIHVDQCELSASGASDMDISNLICNGITVNASGSSDIEMKGKAYTGEINASGSSDIDAFGFIIKELACKASGSSDINIHATESLDVKASGSSDVTYKGNPRTNSIHSSGSADIEKAR